MTTVDNAALRLGDSCEGLLARHHPRRDYYAHETSNGEGVVLSSKPRTTNDRRSEGASGCT
jgi:hypothetical protein